MTLKVDGLSTQGRVSGQVLKNLTKARDKAEHFAKLTQRVPKKEKVAVEVTV